MADALKARDDGELRHLEVLAAVVREGRRPRVAAAGSIGVSCGALVLWTAAGGSEVSKEFSSGNSSISDIVRQLGVPTLEYER